MRSYSTTLAALMLSSYARAQFLINDLSFGYSGKISPDENGVIPNFHLQGAPNLPEILSNKLVLTPVAPGNYRTAVWSDKELNHMEWIADVDFRASGPERGGGNLNIWLVNRGSSDVATSSLYTVGRFEGLVLVIDTYGGTGGMIRGFLNDGSIDFHSKHNLDELAFGHCFYPYRNLGRPSQIKIRQEPKNFKVEIDGRLCFETEKVRLPTGYKFGVTAATPDNPDSFEIFKLVVMADNLSPNHGQASKEQQPPQQQVLGEAGSKTNKNDEGLFTAGEYTADDPYETSIPDKDADTFATSKAQFADLHNRIQSMNHHVGTIFRAMAKFQQIDERRYDELTKLVGELKSEMRRLEGLYDLSTAVTSLEREVQSMRTDLGSKLKDSEHQLKAFMSDHHATLSDHIVRQSPSHRRLYQVIIGGQVLLVVGYVLYKRRRNAMPKKYL